MHRWVMSDKYASFTINGEKRVDKAEMIAAAAYGCCVLCVYVVMLWFLCPR